MNNFFKGMSTIGTLFPPQVRVPRSRNTKAWTSVANDFYKAGLNLNQAINEATQTVDKKHKK